MQSVAAIFFIGILAISLQSNEQEKTDRDNGRSSTQSTARNVGETVNQLENKVTVIFQDRSKHYWFAGGDHGVYRYNGTELVRFTTKDGLPSHAVVGIQEDKKGNIYFDTLKGVSKFDGKQFSTLKVINGEGHDNHWVLNPDDLWFRMGWTHKGPFRFDGKSLYALEFPKNPRADEFHAKFPNADWSPYGIYTMYRDRKGSVWLGTAALGVCRFDGKSFSWLYENHLTQTPAGGDFGIRSIIEDKDGLFWFCNPRFRYEILPEENATLLNYRRLAGVARFNEKSDSEVPYFLSIAKDNDGTLWMATYDDGIWKSDGQTLTRVPIQQSDRDVLLFSIYQDQVGSIWAGSHNAGVFKFNGTTFEPFSVKP